MAPLVIWHRPWSVLGRLVGAAAFVVAGIVMVSTGLPQAQEGGLEGMFYVLVGLASLVFFGGGGLGIAWLACGPALRVDDSGITNRTSLVCVQHVPWEQVAGFWTGQDEAAAARGVQSAEGVQACEEEGRLERPPASAQAPAASGLLDGVEIVFVDPRWPWSRMRGLRALVARANASTGSGPGRILTATLDTTPEELLAQLVRQHSARRAGPWSPGAPVSR
ncbi:hypothetical protein D4740_04195 [Actinomyces sp. 2119]|uniref:hypothetical protein n=1 Tax=Actinomyces sp. 2119 TaxID=2321393 RepID=UPI000E6C5929|nr:hypothetical protein [Actinomyces sp. 2119]RJF43084.1 hypothetical protein D4740_04195 [Actinomyces sp. 2119]